MHRLAFEILGHAAYLEVSDGTNYLVCKYDGRDGGSFCSAKLRAKCQAYEYELTFSNCAEQRKLSISDDACPQFQKESGSCHQTGCCIVGVDCR
jgi:hypothetical protein